MGVVPVLANQICLFATRDISKKSSACTGETSLVFVHWRYKNNGCSLDFKKGRRRFRIRGESYFLKIPKLNMNRFQMRGSVHAFCQ